MWGEAIDSQVTRVEAGVWLVGGISVERMCSSHLACEQGAELCRSQQATGASGGQGGGCVSLGCFWWGAEEWLQFPYFLHVLGCCWLGWQKENF